MGSLHSIYLTRDGTRDLPWRIEQNLASFRNAYPGMAHTLYDLDSGRAFIAGHFDADVLAAWDELVPLAYKSDLLRYCLLYQLGGIYSDVAIHHFFPLTIPEGRDLVVFRDAFNAAPWIVATSLIYSRQQHPVLLRCIEEVVGNVKSRFYGVNPLCPTGPNLFGRMIARHAELGMLASGEAVRINGTRSLVYVDQSGEPIATNIKRGAGLASLGAAHDDYNQHYAMRQIYTGEQGAMSWSAEELRQKGFTKPHSGHVGEREIVAFGPYATLPPGRYRATYTVEDGSHGVLPRDAFTMDVCAECGGKPLPHTAPEVTAGAGSTVAASLVFTLETVTSDIEVRLFSAQRVTLCEQALKIERCAEI